MRRINLLPKTFVQSRQTRHRGIVLGSLCGICIWMLGIAGFAAKLQLDRITARTDHLREEIQTRLTREAERLRLEEQRDRIEKLLALRKVSELPLQPSVVLATLFDLQPDTIVMSRVSVELPPMAPLETSLTPPPAAGGQARRLIEPSKPLNIEISGFAMSDLDAARFVGALSNHPAFTGVMLSSSKRVEVSGTPRFQFQVRAQIPSDRRYHIEPGAEAAAPVAEVRE